jgi:hypothetical protein
LTSATILYTIKIEIEERGQMAYTLRDEGFPFKKIYNGRKWVGRVCRHGDGGFLGIIKGVGEVRASSEKTAFEEIASKAMGYSSAAALKSSNAQARRRNQAVRHEARAVADQWLRGNFEPLFNLLDKGVKS